jgi:hypothetical protein
VVVVAALVAAAVGVAPSAVAGASTSNTVPPACVHQTIPLLGGGGQIQLEVGYCPERLISA